MHFVLGNVRYENEYRELSGHRDVDFTFSIFIVAGKDLQGA